jgi:excinuclease UvrABC nuclease subunit
MDFDTDAQRIEALRAKIKRFPKSPGVYLMKDRRGRVLYVG